ncbi:MAG: hypothetical protein OXI96_08525 [Acidimicrobiaceae bacterium]|nr:hypothetical protein [Acidimicrobiaceae bacterium]
MERNKDLLISFDDEFLQSLEVLPASDVALAQNKCHTACAKN